MGNAVIVSEAELAEGGASEDREEGDQGLSEEQREALSKALLEHEPWMDRLEHLIVDRDEIILRRIIDDDKFYAECYKSYMGYSDEQLLNLGRRYIPAPEYEEILGGGDAGFGGVKGIRPRHVTKLYGGIGGVRYAKEE